MNKYSDEIIFSEFVTQAQIIPLKQMENNIQIVQRQR